MVTLDDAAVKVEEYCHEILKTDRDFLKRFPRVVEVASLLDANEQNIHSQKGRYEWFSRLGVDSIYGFLNQLKSADQNVREKAQVLYRDIRRAAFRNVA